jgi:hypothetical protein
LQSRHGKAAVDAFDQMLQGVGIAIVPFDAPDGAAASGKLQDAARLTPSSPRSNPSPPWRRSPRRARSPRRPASRPIADGSPASPTGSPLTNQVSGGAPPSAFRVSALGAPSFRAEIDPRAVRREGDLQRRGGGRRDRLRRVPAQMPQRRRQLGAGRDPQHAPGRHESARRRAPAARRRRTGSAPPPGGRPGRASGRCRGARPRPRWWSGGRSRSPARRESRRTCRS